MDAGRFEEAASHLAELAAHPQAPTQQRLMSGVAAVDLFENKLQDPGRALTVLQALHGAKLSTLPVRERMAKVATKAGAFEQAVQVLELLMVERDSRDGRIQAARLALAIYRDKLAYCDRPYGAIEGADGLAIVTEWQEFRQPDFEVMRRLMREPVVFDGRNLYDAKVMAAHGFTYEAIGRGAVRPSAKTDA